MNKRFIIEQCRRLDIIHREESKKIKQENDLNCKWILIHNEGHKELIDKFEEFINYKDINDKKVIKKWLKKHITKCNNIIKSLDEKYNYFNNYELMNEKDEEIYNFNDGICCIAYTLLNIISGKKYISK
ncbi:transporter [Clostridiaceae bacterium 14S0207]|nr:transporter [Clostridiaceae bacterium 14S0207]